MVFGAKGARRSGSLGPGVTQNLIQITASIRVRLSHTTVSSPHWKLEPKDDSRPDWSRLQLMLSRRAAIAPGGTAICEHVAGQCSILFSWIAFNLHHAHEHSAIHDMRPLDHTMRYAEIKRSGRILRRGAIPVPRSVCKSCNAVTYCRQLRNHSSGRSP